jgi:hypothetical protein
MLAAHHAVSHAPPIHGRSLICRRDGSSLARPLSLHLRKLRGLIAVRGRIGKRRMSGQSSEKDGRLDGYDCGFPWHVHDDALLLASLAGPRSCHKRL